MLVCKSYSSTYQPKRGGAALVLGGRHVQLRPVGDGDYHTITKHGGLLLDASLLRAVERDGRRRLKDPESASGQRRRRYFVVATREFRVDMATSASHPLLSSLSKLVEVETVSPVWVRACGVHRGGPAVRPRRLPRPVPPSQVAGGGPRAQRRRGRLVHRLREEDLHQGGRGAVRGGHQTAATRRRSTSTWTSRR